MLATSFILLTIAIAIIIFAGISVVSKTAIPDERSRKQFKMRTALVLTCWLVYITVLSLKGVFTSSAFPPKVPLLLVFPPFLFTGFFFASGKFKSIINNTPIKWTVYFQTFRIIVELLLLGMAMNNMIPKEASLEGYNFDVLIGLTAPMVAWLAFSKKAIGKSTLIIWNICGFVTLSIVVFVFMSHAYFPHFWHKQYSILETGFGLFPFTYLAGFLMPAAVFTHVFCLVKLKDNTNKLL